MSSILRALKKLEEETPPEKGSVFVPDAPGYGDPTGQTSARISKKNVLLFGVGLISLVVASVALMAALAIGPFGDRKAAIPPGPEANTAEGQRQTSELKTPDSTPSPAVSSTAGPGKAAKPRSPKPASTTQRRKPVTSLSGKNVATSSRTPPQSQTKNPLNQKSTGVSPKETRKSKAPSRSENVVQEAPPPELNPVAALDNNLNSQNDRVPLGDGREFNPPTLPSAELKLQAISWAENPQQRIAVINGEILNIGEQISGYVVVNIRINDVILQQNGTLWRMIFGNP